MCSCVCLYLTSTVTWHPILLLSCARHLAVCMYKFCITLNPSNFVLTYLGFSPPLSISFSLTHIYLPCTFHFFYVFLDVPTSIFLSPFYRPNFSMCCMWFSQCYLFSNSPYLHFLPFLFPSLSLSYTKFSAVGLLFFTQVSFFVLCGKTPVDFVVVFSVFALKVIFFSSQYSYTFDRLPQAVM